MKIRRWSAGVLAVSLLVPGLAACGSDSTGSATPSSSTAAAAIPADAREALLASVEEISNGEFSFTIRDGETNATGKVHVPTKSAELTMRMGEGSDDLSVEAHLVYIDTDSWVKMQFAGAMASALPPEVNSEKYQHLDQMKVKGLEALEFDLADVDPAGSAVLAKAIVEVSKTGEGTYAGTLDLTKASDSALLDTEVVTALAGQATAVPFTAKLDSQGRLVELAIQMPAAGATPAHNLAVTYADYGATTPVQQPPADQVVEASDELYEMFK